MAIEKKDLVNEPCFIEARNVSNSVMRLIRLSIDRAAGSPVEDELEFELNRHTADELKLKRCIIKQMKTE